MRGVLVIMRYRATFCQRARPPLRACPSCRLVAAAQLKTCGGGASWGDAVHWAGVITSSEPPKDNEAGPVTITPSWQESAVDFVVVVVVVVVVLVGGLGGGGFCF